MSRQLIIVFEGIECSGKSYHIKKIEKLLIKNKKKYISLREPGGSHNSEKIRKIILNNKSNFNKFTDLLLYLAARNENIQQIIKKNYKKKIILIDRFIDSTIAYQHYGMGIDIKIINFLNNYIVRKIKPDFTFLNIVNKKNLRIRLNKRKNKNRYDKFDFKFYNNVQKGFLKLAKNRKKYMIINSNNSISSNSIIILNKIKNLIKL